jgi:hypothetical protein
MYLMRNCVAMRVWFILALINKNATIVKVSKYDTHIYNAYLSNIKKSIIFSPLLMSLPSVNFALLPILHLVRALTPMHHIKI